MLKLIIGEAALEIITDTMINNLNKNDNFINKNFYNKILDKNIHYDIIKKLDNSDKRGRPDIVHFSLLESIDSPLYKNNNSNSVFCVSFFFLKKNSNSFFNSCEIFIL